MLSQSKGPVFQSHPVERGGGREEEDRIGRKGRVGEGGKEKDRRAGEGKGERERSFPIRSERGRNREDDTLGNTLGSGFGLTGWPGRPPRGGGI